MSGFIGYCRYSESERAKIKFKDKFFCLFGFRHVYNIVGIFTNIVTKYKVF